MKNYLAVFMGNIGNARAADWAALTPEAREKRQQEGIAAWMSWGKEHHAAIVEMGSPLGKTKSVGPEGIKDIRNNLTGYTVVRANSHEEAAKMFKGHPHFTFFPGDSIEVMECLPIPVK